MTIELRASNGSDVDLTGLTASGLNVATTGTAALRIVTAPVMRRVLIQNNAHSFRWQGTISGEGTICASSDATGETPDGTTVGTGNTDCGCVTAAPRPTDTPRIRPTLRPTRTPVPTNTPRLRPTPRPTRTPEPTRTPRIQPTRPPTVTPHIRATRTPRPEVTHRVPNPTHTPVPPLPTRTSPPATLPPEVNPGGLSASCFTSVNGSSVTVSMIVNNGVGVEIQDLTADPVQVVATGSAVLSLGPANPDRYSHVPTGNTARFRWNGQISGTGQTKATVSAHATAAGSLVETHVSCDPMSTEAVPTATPRIPHTPVPPLPTRTGPPPTVPPQVNPGGFGAVCRSFQNGNSVSVLLTVRNATGGAATAVQPQPLGLSGDGSLSITSGPAPTVYNLVADATSATFKWNGQLSGAGDVAITASATGIGLGGVPLSTGDVDCGTVGAIVPPPAAFDPTQLFGLCTATVVDGKVLISARLELVNGTGGDLTDVTPFLVDVQTTGSAEVNINNGPNPDRVGSLRDAHRARFRWQGQAQGRGLAFIHVGANATGPNGEAVTTGTIECNTLVIPPRPGH